MAKTFTAEAVWRVVDRSLQICGSLGVSGDVLLGRFLREVRPFRIYDGPSETHRWAIAKRVVKAAPTVTLPGLDLAALQPWFAAAVPGSGELRAELVHGGRSNLTYRLTDGTGTWVLRRPPLGGLNPSAHDMGREYRVVAALAGTRRAGGPRRRAV